MNNGKPKTFDDLRKVKVIEELTPIERDRYLDFLKKSYEDDLSHCGYNSIKFPRWAIISGYYAMHDISKFFLGKKYNLKISKKMVHKATIVAMGEVIREESIKKKILALLEEAQKTYEFINPKDWNIAKFLIKGGKEREKSQYYTGTAFNQQLLLKKANDFSEQVVKPYISIVEDLLK